MVSLAQSLCLGSQQPVESMYILFCVDGDAGNPHQTTCFDDATSNFSTISDQNPRDSMDAVI
jgi:hypothetical protein